MRVFFAVLIARAARVFCRLVHRGGTGLPGRIALKICPDLLCRLSRETACVVVTGTNGKTTSCRMIEEGFRRAGLSYFSNRSGANLIEGIATDFIMNSSLSGKCRKEFAVLEMDEFASREVCRQLQPRVIFVTNLFVDQVERFGGVRGTHDAIALAISRAPSAVVVLNADDSVSSDLGRGIDNRVVTFGLEKGAFKGAYTGFNDAPACISCGEALAYDYRTFSHLGGFRCPGCGRSRPAADYAVTDVLRSDLSGSSVELRSPEGKTVLDVNLPAMYNVYNAVGSYAAMIAMGIPAAVAAVALASFQCGFGRMEAFSQLGKAGAHMVLIKNGAGCDQVLNFLTGVDEDFNLAFYLNNNVSDGVDISWLEDVSFESLSNSRVRHIWVSGMRRAELYDRLLRAGFPADFLTLEDDCAALISTLNESPCPVFILPTYTGMMATRAEIVKQCGGEMYWET